MPDLPKRELGRTGLHVTALGFGAMELRGAPRGRPVDSSRAGEVLNGVLDSGINYIDTSPDYGASEEFIGEHISGRRSEYYLASKCGCAVGVPPSSSDGPSPHIFTRENVIAGVEQSLRRMRTDYLDIVQFHQSPTPAVLEENGALAALVELQRQGKVRFIGMSGTLPNIREQIEMGVFDVFQIPYSALNREHEEIITAASKAGAGIVIRGGAAHGGAREGRRSTDNWDAWKAAGLDDLLEQGESSVEFILRFTMTHPEMDTNIVGTLNPDHLQSNVRAVARGPLPEHIYEEARLRLVTVGVSAKPATARA